MPAKASPLPPGRWVDIPERGRAWVWDTGPAAPRGPGADSERPTVVLLHGWTSTAALNWCRCFRPLAAELRVVAMDHRGHGRGIRSGRPFSLEACADDVAALIRTLGIGSAVVAGYSMGGPVAQLVWRRHPDVVQGLVLCATAASFGGPPLPSVAFQAAGVGLSLALTAVPSALRQEGVRRLVRNRQDQTTMAPWAVAEAESGDPLAYVQAALALGRFDSTSWLGSIDRPAAVVITGADHLVAPDRQRALARAIPGAATFTIDADHRACVEAVDQFVPALLDACRHVTHRRRSSSRESAPPTRQV